MIRALPRVALQVWIVLFILFFGAEVVHLEPGLRILTQLLYGLPLVLWLAWRLRGPADRLEWLVLGLLVLYAVICLFSRDRTESLGTLGLASAYAGWFMLMRRADARLLREPIAQAACTGLALTLVYNAYLLIQEKVEWFSAVGAAPFEGVMTFPWESVNALPILVLLAIPFLTMLNSSPVRTAIGVAIAISAVVVVPLSLGRAGWLGLTVAGMLLVVGEFQGRRRLQVASALAMAATLALVVVGPRLVAALADSGRLLLWEQGLNMIEAAPFLGNGPGVFSWVRLEFPPAPADLVAVRLLHNAPLQTLADGGLALMSGVASVIVGWAMAVGARLREWSLSDRVAAAAIGGFGAALLLDDFSYLPAITALALTLAAFLVPVSITSKTWTTPAVLAMAGLLAMPNVIGVDLARSAAQSGRTAMVEGHYADAVVDFSVATNFHPEDGAYWLGLGMASAYDGDDDAAADAYRRAIAAAPGDPRGYGALAELDDGARIQWLEDAAARTLGDPQYAIRLGIALAADGRFNDATDAWAEAVALLPELLRLLPYDKADVSREAVARKAEIALAAGLRPGPAESLAARWDLALAIDALPETAGSAWRAIDAARHGNVEEGRNLAEAAVAEMGYAARSYRALAAVAQFACDPGLERRALEMERATGDTYTRRQPEPYVRREFVYREASLGPSQPQGATPDIEVEPWPWSLIDRPADCG